MRGYDLCAWAMARAALPDIERLTDLHLPLPHGERVYFTAGPTLKFRANHTKTGNHGPEATEATSAKRFCARESRLSTGTKKDEFAAERSLVLREKRCRLSSVPTAPPVVDTLASWRHLVGHRTGRRASLAYCSLWHAHHDDVARYSQSLEALSLAARTP